MTRNIDLSVASVIGLSAYGAARFVHVHPHSPVLVGVGVAILIGLACGGLNGLVVTVGRVPAIVVTLGTLSVFRGVNSLWAGGKQISADQVPQSWLDLTSSRILGVPAVVLVALATLVLIGIALRRLPFGRELYAIGSNPEGAALIGIRAKTLVLGAFMLAGMLAGFDGALWASRYATIDARVALGFELTVIASVVVGGVAIRGGAGTVLGVALGALTLLVIQNGLTLVRSRSALAAGRIWPRHPARRRHRRFRWASSPAFAEAAMKTSLLERLTTWETFLLAAHCRRADLCDTCRAEFRYDLQSVADDRRRL